MGFIKEKYLSVPCTVFKSHYFHLLFGIFYSAGYRVNKSLLSE